MEPTVEQRLDFLENRVQTLEALLEAPAAPVRAPAVAPTAQPRPVAPAPAPAKPARDLEEYLGGHVLGWVGGIAIVIAAVFFVVMAVRNGWIGEAARMELAFAASAALVLFGVWVYERRGRDALRRRSATSRRRP